MMRYPHRSVLVSAFLLFACGEAGAPAADMAAVRFSRSGEAVAVLASQTPPADQKLIRSGELQVQVADVEEAVRHVDSIVRAHGGLVADTRTTTDDDGRQRAHVTLRVPAERFNATMDALRALGDVRSAASSQQDITKAYVDLETRLAVKEEALGRLRGLLSGRTGRLSDVLEVEREITRVLSEIEQMKGERRYYDNQVALASITMNVFEPGALRAPPRMSIGLALGRSLEVLNTSIGWLLYLVTFLAPWVALASGVWWLGRTLRRRRAS